MSSRWRSAGMSLLEVVIFIVIVGLVLAGMMFVFSASTRASVDPMIRKQALAIGSSLLEEIELRAFTFCDPDDSNVYTATGPPPTGCTTVEGIGPETTGGTETRYVDPRFDNVNDYNGFQMGSGATDPSIRTAANSQIDALSDFRVDVTVAPIAAGELGADVATTSEALLITVTTRHVPTGTTVALQGYRLRYAPNSP